LLAARRNVSTWKPLILGSFVFAFALAATNPAAGNYPSFGNALNWILGLPCWLGGCWLADRVVNSEIPQTPTRGKTWIWRASILGIATILSILRFHSPLGYPWTLNLFGIVVVFWLANEISWFMARPPNRWLEWAGQWSYSVYLFHVLALPIYLLFEMPNFGVFFNWFWKMFFIMATSYLVPGGKRQNIHGINLL
jgi:peptidoglycan/LPS O-acetylase OafA/YrhL